MSSYMSDADDPSESSSDDNLEHDYETTEDEGQNDSSDNSYSDVSDEECGTEMDAPETSISQDIHTMKLILILTMMVPYLTSMIMD